MAVGQTQRNILLPKGPSSNEYQLNGVNKAATCKNEKTNSNDNNNKNNDNNNNNENKFLT